MICVFPLISAVRAEASCVYVPLCLQHPVSCARVSVSLLYACLTFPWTHELAHMHTIPPSIHSLTHSPPSLAERGLERLSQNSTAALKRERKGKKRGEKRETKKRRCGSCSDLLVFFFLLAVTSKQRFYKNPFFLIQHVPHSSFPPISSLPAPSLTFSSLTPFSTLLITVHPSPPSFSEACWEMCQRIRACSGSRRGNSMALRSDMDWGKAGRAVTAVNSGGKGQCTALGPDTVLQR